MQLVYSDLINSYKHFLSYSDKEKSEYSQIQVDKIHTFAGIYYSNARKMQTSGTSSGMVKEYRWGPDYNVMNKFYYYLLFDWFNPQKIFYLKFQEQNKDFSFTHIEENRYIASLSLKNPLKTFQNFISTIDHRQNTVLWIVPYQAKLLQHFNIDLSILDNKRFIVYSTGENLDQETADYYKTCNITCINGMRNWFGGSTFITCQSQNLHWIDFLSKLELDDNNYLYSTDYYNLAQPMLRICTQDQLSMTRTKEKCPCGLDIDHFKFINKHSSVVWRNKTYIYNDLYKEFNDLINQNTTNKLLMCTFVLSDVMQIHYLSEKPINNGIADIMKKNHNCDIKLINKMNVTQFKGRKIVLEA